MAANFLDLVMEAKGRKPIKINPNEDHDATDYTDDVEGDEVDEQETDELDNDEETSEDDNNESEEDDLSDEPEEVNDEDVTDYTETEEEIGDDNGPDDTDNGGSEEDEPTDYTSYDDEAGGDGSETGDDSDQPSDYSDDGNGDDYSEGDENAPEEGEEGPTSEDRKNKALLDDLIRLKDMVTNFIDKTSSINGTDVSQVKFVNQVNNNLGALSRQIHNYIIFRFSNESYIRNLYFYNNSVEALNISINMLKKINGFKHNK